MPLPASPKARPKEELEEERRGMIQKFLDDWHYDIVRSKLAGTWGRQKILGLALDVLELKGLQMPASGKEALLKLEEHEIVWYISDNLPDDLCEHFEDLTSRLMKVCHHLTGMRQALEAGDQDAVVAAFEGEQSAPRTVNCILQQTVEFSSHEVARLRKTHHSWRDVTEARIHRLTHAQDEADSATNDLINTSSRLEAFRGHQSGKAQTCLVALTEASVKAMLNAYFCGWRGVAEESKAELEMKAKYEAQVEEMQQLFLKYQADRLKNVTSAMMRSASEGATKLLGEAMSCWCDAVAESKKLADSAAQMKAVQEKLRSAQDERAASAKKVISSMLGDSESGPLVLCWQAWQQFSVEYKKQKLLDDAVKDLETQLKEKMDKKKGHLTSVMRNFTEIQDENFVFEILQAWAQLGQQEKRVREMDDALSKSGSKLSMLRSRQKACAGGVQGRINSQADFIFLERYLSGWVLQTKTVRVEQHLKRKLETKRKQLAGVQQLFQTFASQIESNLDIDDGDDSKRSSREHRPRGKHGGKGLNRGNNGAVSLPDIHQRSVGMAH